MADLLPKLHLSAYTGACGGGIKLQIHKFTPLPLYHNCPFVTGKLNKAKTHLKNHKHLILLISLKCLSLL